MFLKDKQNDLGNYSSFGMTLIPENIMEHSIWDLTDKGLKDSNVINASLPKIIGNRSCQTEVDNFT